MGVITRKEPVEAWRIPAVGPCTCSQVRKTARALTAFYDKALEPQGLSVTQYAVLVSVGRADGITRTALAARLGMDRTTLTRNLLPLERAQLLEETPGEDRRQRVLRASTQGRDTLDRCYPLWEQAQRAFIEAYGAENAAALGMMLREAATAVMPDPVRDAPSPSPDIPAR